MATSYDRPIHGRRRAGDPHRPRRSYLSLESDGGLIANDDPYETDFQVIHSFWAPRLFGKQDVVPGRTNHILFSADEPGTYTGQCAEFCGLQHGTHEVPDRGALDPPTGRRGSRTSSRPAPSPTDPLAAQGQELFLNPLLGRARRVHGLSRDRRDRRRRRSRARTSRTSPSRHAPCFAGCNWETDRRGGAHGVAREPGRGQARREDAQLPPDRRGDRRPRRLPVQPDVMEAIANDMASVSVSASGRPAASVGRRR